MSTVGRTLHRVGIPLWTPSLPKAFYPGGLTKKKSEPSNRKLVYFPSCLNRVMGPSEESGKTEALADVFVRLCNKAGYEVIFPENMEGLCCGMIWESKGMPDIADSKTRELEGALQVASQGGKIPVVCDQSPCLHRMRDHIKSMKLYEPSEFIHDYLAPHLEFHPHDTSIAVHVTCSSLLMGLGDKIIALAKKCSTNVTVPSEIGCCGFAGDKGFTHPELNAWAVRNIVV